MNKKHAFTMAEVLITLGVIGIVVAMTLPAIIAKYRKTEIETKLKRIYTIMNQAVLMSKAEETWTQPPTDKRYDNDVLIEWMERALFPYFNGGVEVEKDHNDTGFENCVRMRLKDGSYLYANNNIQIHIFYDINGDKKPNKGGVDIFYFFLDYEDTNKRGGNFYPSGYSFSNANNPDGPNTDNSVYGNREKMKKFCDTTYSYERSNTCALLIMHDGWKIKKDYPVKLN